MLLALDTSTREIGVALYEEDRVLNETVWYTTSYHTVELAPAVVQALERAGRGVDQLRAIGVALGPGSFTSLRVGLAFAKGLALVRQIPVIGIPTLDIVASAQPIQEMPLAAVVEAGRGRLAVGWYHPVGEAWHLVDEITIMTPQELTSLIQRPTLICGELPVETRRVLRRKYRNARVASPARSLRRPSFLAELAWRRWQEGQVPDPATLAPIYLRTKPSVQMA